MISKVKAGEEDLTEYIGKGHGIVHNISSLAPTNAEIHAITDSVSTTSDSVSTGVPKHATKGEIFCNPIYSGGKNN